MLGSLSSLRLRLLIGLSSLALILSLCAPLTANAASGFQSGRIMDDPIFFNTSTMTAGDIQTFLNSKVPVCDSNGAQIYSGSETRAQYAASNGVSTPFICLKDFSQTMPTMAADAYCNAISGGGASAATIIETIAQACSINPEVLLVLLQKEQGLVTDDWPWPIEYQAATGFGCPDTASCDSTYAGFFNQLYYAARQFQRYVKQPGSFNYAVGQNSYVLYNPNVNCGGSNITMQTQATAALYNYTPYQPNTAALNNLYGNGDSCSAYGNRNFWRYFNDWFGPTTSDSNAYTLDILRLNHSSGFVESVGLSSISSYQAISRYNVTNFPSTSADGTVVPLADFANNNLSFVKLTSTSGRVEIITYSGSSGYQQTNNDLITNYPDVAGDGAVIPLYEPSGNLSFVRLNHSSGRTEIATWGASSGYQKLVDYHLTAYPAVKPDGSVVPLITPSGDLSFVRLNHSSGRTEIATFSASSGYQKLVDYHLTAYPAVTPDGSVIPFFQPNGDLSFIRLNFSSGRAEIATFSASSGYQKLVDYQQSAYPSVADFTQLRVVAGR